MQIRYTIMAALLIGSTGVMASAPEADIARCKGESLCVIMLTGPQPLSRGDIESNIESMEKRVLAARLKEEDAAVVPRDWTAFYAEQKKQEIADAPRKQAEALARANARLAEIKREDAAGNTYRSTVNGKTCSTTFYSHSSYTNCN